MSNTATAPIPEPAEEPSNIVPVSDAKFQADLRLDTASVAAKIVHYPAEVKESVLWLASFTTEFCSGRRGVLAQRVRDLKIDGGPQNLDSYLYQVLTGRYFKPDKTRPGKFLGSTSTLLKIVNTLRSGVLLNERVGKLPFIETETWGSIRDYVDTIRMAGAVNKFGAIFGPTGRQKSASAKHYCHIINHAEDNDGSRCVHVEAEGPSITTFLTDLTFRFGNGMSRTTARKKVEIARCVNDKTTIFADNVQRLYRPGYGGDQPIFNYMQKLQDDTGCTVILEFANIYSNFLTQGLEEGYFEQFEGRCGGRENFLILEDYATDGDLLAMATACGMAGTEKEIEYLRMLSRKPGRDRIVLDGLQKGLRERGGRKGALTVHDIKLARGDA